VLYFPLNEGTWVPDGNTNDLSPYTNYGLQRGNPLWVASSPQGTYALDFNGVNDYVRVNTSTSLHPTAAVSLAVWIKPNDCGNYEANPYIQNPAYIIRNSTGNNFEFTIHTPTNNDYSAVSPADSSFNGVWHHLAGTFDGRYVKLYVDSVLENTVDTNGTTLATNTTWVGIAASPVSPEYFSGMLDEIRIYNKALSQTEVAWLATNGTGHFPITSPANLYKVGLNIINLKDFAMLADGWLEEQLWP
ncbi:MAG: LamG domain-containing protein, partial [Sedimentisphaerales bacterium]